MDLIRAPTFRAERSPSPRISANTWVLCSDFSSLMKFVLALESKIKLGNVQPKIKHAFPKELEKLSNSEAEIASYAKQLEA